MTKKQIMLHGYRYFIVYVTTDDNHMEIANHMETRFDASYYELEGKINLNNELDGKIMT